MSSINAKLSPQQSVPTLAESTPEHGVSRHVSDRSPGSTSGGTLLGGLRTLGKTPAGLSPDTRRPGSLFARMRPGAAPPSQSVAAASEVHRPEAPNLSKSDMRPGDVLLLIDESGNSNWTHRAIVMGQKLAGASLLRDNSGDSKLVHSVMWTKAQNNPGNNEPQGKGEPEIAEVRGGNRLVSQGTALRQGLYRVYRPTDENVGDWAAQISMIWADNRTAIPYNKPASVLSVVRNSTFGSKAAARSERYAAEAFDSTPAWGADGSFCSSFIVAANQAAAQQTGHALSGANRVDAKSTSVRTLEHFLKSNSDQFTDLGHIRIKPEDVLYQD
ncbi:hypothetical protein [Paraburkholderia sp.]|uniref:hypothetical protein n=1 Tax=Paraburkholderia sp. TaxID=1926495 RepID=UPI003D6FF94C